ncbi:MAG: hypothetical protein ACP5NV_06455 [Candidatus Woesearchaeota archaeon]
MKRVKHNKDNIQSVATDEKNVFQETVLSGRDITKVTKNTKNIKVTKNISGDNGKFKKINSKYVFLFLLLLFVFLLGIFLTILFFNNYKLLQYDEIDISVNVRNGSSSFNTSTDALNFARIYPGGSATKLIGIFAHKDSIVRMKISGNISEFIMLSDNDFLIKKNETRQIQVMLDIPESTIEGPYSGKLKIYFYRS